MNYERCFARGDGGPHEPRYRRKDQLNRTGMECTFCGREMLMRVDLAAGQSHPGDTADPREWGSGVGWPD